MLDMFFYIQVNGHIINIYVSDMFGAKAHLIHHILGNVGCKLHDFPK